MTTASFDVWCGGCGETGKAAAVLKENGDVTAVEMPEGWADGSKTPFVCACSDICVQRIVARRRAASQEER